MTQISEAKATVDVIVRTPAGASHDFTFKRDELVAEAAARAIKYFVDKHDLEAGDYGLELVRDGVSTEMLDTNELSDYEVRDGDVLFLVPEKPQVDG